MLVSLVAALLLMTQSDSDIRGHAERLARTGHTVEAMELFKQVVAQNPNDAEARLWVARLDLRMGKVDEAETALRAVLREHPGNVDAKIELGNALMRKGAPDEALTILLDAEREAGENADFYAALGRAYRRTGDARRALECLTRAKALSPHDPDVRLSYEAVALAYGHSIVVEGVADQNSTGMNTSQGSFATSVRVLPRLHLDGSVRLAGRSGDSDALGGGGALLRLGRSSNLGIHASGGSHNTILPTSDTAADFTNYAGVYEFGTSLRRQLFDGVHVFSLSPTLAWDLGRSRLDSRYTYSRLEFDTHNRIYRYARLGAAAIDKTTGDHSVFFRETWRGWRRTWLHVVYAYGIESFETLTIDRIGSLGATTVATGVRFNAPSLTTFNANWEHQWRSNSTSVNRYTVGLVQTFP
jgi:tetratricopeptide (TPR) repeat protein